MHLSPIHLRPALGLLAIAAAFSQISTAKTLCVHPKGANGCWSTIQAAVNAASSHDVITVAAGTYHEDVTIGKPLSLIGAGAKWTVIDATKLPNGFFVDGLDHRGLYDVTITGFTVKNALYEGILLVNTDGATIRNNSVVNNDAIGPVYNPAGGACKGQPSFETDESGDCGGGLHLMGVTHSIVSDNYLTGNGDGILISDETGESRGNLITHNVAAGNPYDCGIVLASHQPMGSSAPHFARHYGVDSNTISENVSTKNGLKAGGAGIGLFSNGNGPGRVAGNVIIRNQVNGNGHPGVSLHTHVGPAYGAPADDMSGNVIIGNTIWGNGQDSGDTGTPGTTGININSGGGGSPVYGAIISENVIRDEDVAIAVNTPAEVDAHLNDLLGGNIGVANVCALDKASCTGWVDATENYWGCAGGPGAGKCSTVSGKSVLFTPWLGQQISPDSTQSQ